MWRNYFIFYKTKNLEIIKYKNSRNDKVFIKLKTKLKAKILVIVSNVDMVIY